MNTPLVLLHGWGMRADVWQPLSDALGTHAQRGPAPSLPGHDGLPAPAATTVAAWSDALLPALPPRAVLLGWSLGAMLALDLAARHPGRVEALVLIGASPRFVAASDWPAGLDAATVDAFRQGFADDPAATLRRFVALQALGDARRRAVTTTLTAHLQTPDTAPAPVPSTTLRDAAMPADPHSGFQHSRAQTAVPGHLHTDTAAEAAPRRAALGRGLDLLADIDLRSACAGIRQPTLLLHGEADALMPLAAARWLADTLPDARLHTFAGCGHAPFVGETAACAAAITQFLDARQR